MALYDSVSLLGIFNRKAGRPAADAVSDASKYQRLSESQSRVVAMIAGIVPKSLYPKVAYGSIPTLTSTDGQVFTFGTGTSGFPIFPMGKGGIYPSLDAIPNHPWVEGIDFMSEGNQIRIPNNGTYSGTLYWYGIAQPGDIDATNQPSIIPEAARDLIVVDAVRQFAVEYARQPDLAQLMAAEWALAWPHWCLVWKTQFKHGGALSLSGGGVGGSGGGGGTSGTDAQYWGGGYFGHGYFGSGYFG